DVSEALLLDTETLRTYVKKYRDGGIEHVLKRNHKGSVGRMTEDQKNDLKNHLSEYTYMEVNAIIKHVKDTYGISFKSTRMREILRELGFVYKKPKIIPGNVKPVEALNFLQKYEEMRRSGIPLYFMDGVHPQHNSQPSYGWILEGTNKALPSNTGRKRLNINGVVNIDSFNLITIVEETLNSQSTIELFKKIVKKHKGDDKIYIVCDNAGYYRSKEVKKYLEITKKIELVFLPPYSPFLNLIERVWKYFKKMIIYNRYYPKFSEFKDACLIFFKRRHKRALKKILTEKFHFSDQKIEILKPIYNPR
ncbi:unnamed protein product, partial [marine sediment metagenome]